MALAKNDSYFLPFPKQGTQYVDENISSNTYFLFGLGTSSPLPPTHHANDMKMALSLLHILSLHWTG